MPAVALVRFPCLLAALAALVAAEPAAGMPLPPAPQAGRSELAGSGGFTWRPLLRDPAVDRPETTARSGDRERATVVTPAAAAGSESRVRLDQWQGDTGAGGRATGGNTLHGRPGETAWVRLIDWRIETGGGNGDQWSWGTSRGRDARLRLAYCAGELGDAVPFAGPLPVAAVVVDLSFRHAIGGGEDWTLAGEAPCAVIQVPAGVSLADARKEPSNVLAVLGVLKKQPPRAGAPAFRFQVLAGGRWRLALDVDADGTADLDLDESGPGHQPWTAGPLTRQHGLVVAVAAAGGNRAGTVGRTTVTLGLRAQPDQAPTTAVDRRPLALEQRRHVASPALLMGRRHAADLAVAATLTREGEPPAALPVHALGDHRFALVVDLDDALPVTLRLSQQGTPPTVVEQQPEWEAVRLTHAPELVPSRLLVGQRLRVAHEGRGIGCTLTRDGAPVWSTVPAPGPAGAPDPRPPALVALAAPGSYRLAARDIASGKELAARDIAVAVTDLPATVGVAAGKPRGLDVWCPSVRADNVRAQIVDGPAKVAIAARSGPLLRLRVESAPGASTLALLDAAGSEIGRSRVVAFRLDLVDGGAGVVAHQDGAMHPVPFRLRMQPYVPGVSVRFTIIDSACVFRGGAGSFTVDSGGGASSNGEAGFKRSGTGADEVGLFDYAILLPNHDASWAHRFHAEFPEEVAAAAVTGAAARPPAPTAKPPPAVRPPPKPGPGGAEDF